MFKFDRDKFFDGFRKNINLLGVWSSHHNRFILTQSMVDGLNDLLDRIEKDSRFQCLNQIAYVFATDAWETGHAYQPVKEKLAKKFTSLWWKQMVYYPFIGRGDVQLTWRANYQAEGERLNVGNLFVKKPDGVLKREYSYEILVGGMFLGRFRKGNKLTDYIDCSGKKLYHNARNVVNSKLDHAAQITRIALAFDVILEQSEVK